MAITFTRAEFFALAALYQADEIIGLDAAVLLPTDPESRAALYAEGRARHLARGMLRADDRGQLEPDRTLDAVMRAIVAPVCVVWVSRHLPSQGRQWFLYYGSNDNFVEQTLPDATSHRLAVIGDVNDLVSRLLTILQPVWRMMTHHGIALEAHGQNLLITHDEGWPTGLVARDFHESLEYVPDLLARPELLPDLILLDIMMPKVDGLEVVRRLKADGALPFIPVILVTARASQADVVAGLDSGGDD